MLQAVETGSERVSRTTPEEPLYRVFIVDDHVVVRRGVATLFESESEFIVSGEAADVGEALEKIEASKPDLVVTDLSLRRESGLDLIQRLQRVMPGVPVLVLSMHDEELYAVRAFRSGASGYVSKRTGEGEILSAARAVLQGHLYVSGERPVDEVMRVEGAHALTDRELDVFRLIGEGFAPRHIAERLNLSVSTIEVYRERLKEKLGLTSSPMLVRFAVRWFKDEVSD